MTNKHCFQAVSKSALIFYSMEIGKNIKRIRKELGMTQAQLADKTDLKQYLITKYENGVINPMAEKIERIAQAMGVTVNDIYGSFDENQNAVKAHPKKSSRVGKMIEVFEKLDSVEQRFLLKQAKTLAES